MDRKSTSSLLSGAVSKKSNNLKLSHTNSMVEISANMVELNSNPVIQKKSTSKNMKIISSKKLVSQTPGQNIHSIPLIYK